MRVSSRDVVGGATCKKTTLKLNAGERGKTRSNSVVIYQSVLLLTKLATRYRSVVVALGG
jgi:hypothetical protein